MQTLTTKQAAEILGVQTQTVRRYCNEKRFRCLKGYLGVGDGDGVLRWCIDAASFDRWAKLPRPTGRPVLTYDKLALQ